MKILSIALAMLALLLALAYLTLQPCPNTSKRIAIGDVIVLGGCK